MKKTTKCLIAILTLLFTMLSTNSIALAKSISVPSATSDFYVNDFAEVFSEEQKSRLMENAIKLSDKYDGAQVVITTVKSLDGNAVEDYSYEMYNQYGIGKNDMGILILLSTRDKQIRIEVGKAMEAYINDSKAGRFIDEYAIPFLKEKKFDEGLIKLQEALISEVKTDLEKEDTSDGEQISKNKIDFSKFWTVILIIVVILVIVALIFISVRKSKQQEQMVTIIRRYEEISNQNKKLKLELENSNNDCSNLKAKLSASEEKIGELEEWKKKVYKICPNIQEQITKYEEEEKTKKDKYEAKSVDTKIENVSKIRVSTESAKIQMLSCVISAYEGLSEKQKKLVKGNISKVKKIYKESLRKRQKCVKEQEEKRCKQEAKDAKNSILSIISSVGIVRATDYRNLENALAIYNRLSSEAKSYFDKSLYNELQELYKKAKRLKEDEEDENDYDIDDLFDKISFLDRFDVDSSFEGFGGSSGGGGAGRSF